METYGGTPADEIRFAGFAWFLWQRKKDLWRFLHWTDRMRR
jgi:hypothetical protein